MNQIIVSGAILSKPEFSHEVYGEKFYSFYIETSRESGTTDVLPCMVSEVFIKQIEESERIKIIGQVRTRNVFTDTKTKLEITVFGLEVLPYEGVDENTLHIQGFLCKEPRYRKTPLGREISDFVIAANRKYNKSDYLPCITWGRNARKIISIPIGEKLEAVGRLQSRPYIKRLADGVTEKRIAYEFSVSKLGEIAEVENDNED